MEPLKLKDLYTFKPDTQSYELEIDIDHYQDMFNTWDAAPLKRKDIEPDLMDYLETAGRDIPLKYPVDVTFVMPETSRDEKKELITKDALYMQFRYAISLVTKELAFNYRRMAIFTVTAVIFLISNYIARDQVTDEIFNILFEGLTVGGWFLLWNVFSIMILDNALLYKRRQVLARFLKTKVEFRNR